MKAYNVISLVIALFVSGALSSCSDLLDVENVNKVSPEGFISDSRTKENAVIAAYVLTYRAISQQGAWAYHSDVRSGLCVANGDLYSTFKNQDLLASNPVMETLRDWNRYYDAIAQCNYVIDELANVNSEYISEDEKQRATGEALYLRSYLFFYLNRVWGDVPLIVNHGAEGEVSKSTTGEVLDKVIADLEIAETLLPDFIVDESGEINPGSSRRRVTRPAVLALLSRVALETGDLPKGISAFESFEAIEDANYSLERETSISDVFSGSSRENIFGFQNTTDFYSDNYNPYVETINLPGGEMKMIVPDTVMLKSLYDESDTRISSYFDDNNGVVTVQKFSTDYLVVSRYGELLLTAAELYLADGNIDKATELVNRIRNRASLDEVEGLAEAELSEVLKTERIKELFAEGHSFFDFMRWGETAQRVPGISDSQVAAGIEWWPLSRESLGGFFKVSQNAYWN